jgi:hypothetical protein
MTIGVFTRPTVHQPLRLFLKPAAPPKAGKPIQIHAMLEGAPGPVAITGATAEIVTPRMALNSIRRIHADALAAMKGDDAERLLALRRLLLPKGDLLGHQQRMMPLAIANAGRSTFTATNAAVEGSLNCKVHVQGLLGTAATPFELTELLSLHVPA